MKKIISSLISRSVLIALIGAGSLLISTKAGFCTGPTWVTWDPSVGGNGHQYLAVPGYAGLNWNTANTLAQAQGGYLASITSAAENNFVFSLINHAPFFNSFNGAGPAIGGYQTDALAEPAGHWAWTSGEAWSYTNWGSSLPNNIPPGPDKLIYYSGIGSTPAPTWDDLPGTDGGALGLGIGGYVVEVVPEPSSLAIVGCASLLFARRFTAKRK